MCVTLQRIILETALIWKCYIECIIVHGSMPLVSSSASPSLATPMIRTILPMFVTARCFATEVDYYKLFNMQWQNNDRGSHWCLCSWMYLSLVSLDLSPPFPNHLIPWFLVSAVIVWLGEHNHRHCLSCNPFPTGINSIQFNSIQCHNYILRIWSGGERRG